MQSHWMSDVPGGISAESDGDWKREPSDCRGLKLRRRCQETCVMELFVRKGLASARASGKMRQQQQGVKTRPHWRSHTWLELQNVEWLRSHFGLVILVILVDSPHKMWQSISIGSRPSIQLCYKDGEHRSFMHCKKLSVFR